MIADRDDRHADHSKGRLAFSIAVAATVGLAGLLAACAAPPARFAGPDPANPDAAVPPAPYKPVITSYIRQQPAEPTGWRDQNDHATAPPKP